MPSDFHHSPRAGFLLALVAYTWWALASLYFKAMAFVSPIEIVAHRIIWTALLCLLLLRGVTWMGHYLARPRLVLLLLVCSLLVGCNWLLFVWAVNTGHMLEASLGYFINPLLTLGLSMVFFGERFRRLQWLAIVLAIGAIAIPLWRFGAVPWIALGLAGSFACYGLIRKKLDVDSLSGLAFETMLTVPLAVYFLMQAHSATSNLWNNPVGLNLALASAGVITLVPLLCYVAAARRIKLSTLGIMQYINPSIIFALAIAGFGEVLSTQQAYSFALVWVALLIYSFDALHYARRHTVTQPDQGYARRLDEM